MGTAPVTALTATGTGNVRDRPVTIRGIHVGGGVVVDGAARYVSTGTGAGGTGGTPTTTKIGMASGDDATFNARVAETGPVHARRKFVPHMTTSGTGNASTAVGLIEEASIEKAAGRYVVYSSKYWIDPSSVTPRRWTWEEVAAGMADAQLDMIAAALAAEPVTADEACWLMHHEPRGDGDLPAWAAATNRMVARIAPQAPNWRLACCINGFVMSAKSQGKSDAEIAANELPDYLIETIMSNGGIIAADCYHGGTIDKPGSENAGPKITRFSEWADRHGVNRLGIAETNGIRASDITDAFNAVLADERYVFACIFNSAENNREGVDWLLAGDRLAAFKAFL